MFSHSQAILKWKWAAEVAQARLSAQSSCWSVSMAWLCPEPAVCVAASSLCWLCRVRAGALQFTVSDDNHAHSADVGAWWRLWAKKSTQPLERLEQLVNIYNIISKASFGSVWSRTAWAGVVPAVLRRLRTETSSE